MRFFCYFTLLPICIVSVALGNSPQGIGRNLVRISATGQTPDYTIPWNPGVAGDGVGAGFVVAGEFVMTNAHVVSNTRFIVLTREDDPKQYVAKVKYIAHDCDLALLDVQDKSFFEKTDVLAFGNIPELESSVSVYGYPLGGDRASVTRGVVSRIDFLPYAHSQTDSHMAIQIDAAINPGNSGGPVMQDGKVVGVAFQSYTGDVAQNVGYMIPTPVINRFLADIKDGHYDRYVDLAVSYYKLLNPAMRKALGLKEDQVGVMIASVLQNGTCDGILKKGDVLLAIDGHAVSQDGYVELDGKRIAMPEIVERKLKGDLIKLDVIRDGEAMSFETPLKPIWQYDIQSARYDVRPRFVLFGGLLFQPLAKDMMEAYRISDLRIRYYYDFFMTDQIYKDRPEIIILSQILPDPTTAYLSEFDDAIIEEINGVKIQTLEDVSKAFKIDTAMHVIKTEGNNRPIVLEASKIEEARKRILPRYNVLVEENLNGGLK